MACGYAFHADGSATALNWDDVKSKPLRDGQRSWIHLNRTSLEVQDWLRNVSGLSRIEADIMLEEDTRPRCLRQDDALLLNLRGVNLNDGADPADMIALRFFVHKDTVLTMRSRPLKVVQDLMTKIESGKSPGSSGALTTFLAENLIDRIDSVILQLDEQASDYEDKMLAPDARLPKTALAEFRRNVLQFRRYIVPQREALNLLVRESGDMFSADELLTLRETANQITRLAEDLDTVRERSLVLQEQVVEQRAEAMNERLFVLSIISAVFLPLGFLTGLFGINVGGMPGVESPLGFGLVVLSCLALTAVLFAILRWHKWI
jgi:zinc transporter